ncbi:MAG: hypothetical protein ABIL09_17080 [Gemmatimonadota bacterium]
MRPYPTTPWHRASFDHFLHRSLPDLLTRRLGLRGYRAGPDGEYACRIALEFQGREGPLEVEYPSLPAPNQDGVFLPPWVTAEAEEAPEAREPLRSHDGTQVGGPRYPGRNTERVVVPLADNDDLAAARIACVGEQLLAFIESRLGQLPEEVDLDEALVRALAPLEAWLKAFLTQTAQVLQNNNWTERATHLRRLVVPDNPRMFTPGHFGRTCPFETPEGPNIGRVLTVARGAEIRDGRLVVVDDSPVAGLGLGAACVPFLEHDDGNRVLMGVNMMRQYLPPEEPEPALVQTGYEPDVPGFWAGRNLLTAFVSWDGDAFEDALVVSASAAAKLACPLPLEPGDKLSNRHGTKGVVSRVVPDDQMPRLPDGTPVELVFSFSGVPSRWTVGQLREAALGRVAHAAGKPAVVPPFGAPSDQELRQRLVDAGLPETGMDTLTDRGQPLNRPCTVGWVYWGCLTHLVRDKLHTCTHPDHEGQRLGRMEVQALCEAGAQTVIRDLSNTGSAEREDAAELAGRVSTGAVQPATTPSPRFAAVAQKLGRAGIRAEVGPGGVTFSLRAGGGASLFLARPVPHPWLPEAEVTEVAADEGADGYGQVAAANQHLARLVDSGAPEPLVEEAARALSRAVAGLYDGLLSPADLTLGTRVLFSGRTVITPGPDLAVDQLGLPEEMAWALYGPQVAARLGDPVAASRRTRAAAVSLAEVMAASWIVLNRAPSVGPTSLLAFHPVSIPQKAFRLHPLACRLLNADFDGDQAAVFLPLTEAGQLEAGEKLSIAGHLRRDPGLIEEIFPSMDALFGLACLSLTQEGRRAIAKVAGQEPPLTDGILTRDGVVRVLGDRLASGGPGEALALSGELMHLGFAAARREGGSVGPFVGSSLDLPKPPAGDEVAHWQAYMEEVWARVALFRGYDDPDMGAVCLLSHSGARATAAQVAGLCAPGGLVRDVHDQVVPVRGSWRSGLSPAEAFARVVGARQGLQRVTSQYFALGGEHEAATRPPGHGVLARARRAEQPGPVFARAAARGEVDPLTDEYARLFVGLPSGRR